MNDLQGSPIEEQVVKRPSRRGLWIVLVVIVLLGLVGTVGGSFVRGAEEGNVVTGRTAVVAGNWVSAIDSLTAALEAKPAFLRQYVTEATALRGTAYYWQGAYEEALADLDASLARNENQVDLYVYRMDSHLQQGALDAALADSETALTHKDLLPEALLALVYGDRLQMFVAQGQRDEALAVSELVLAHEAYLPDEVVALAQSQMALVAFAEGEGETAVAAARTAMALDDDLADETLATLLMEETAVFYAQNQLEASLSASQSALDHVDALSDEQLAELYQMRANIFYQQGHLEEAVAAAEVAADHDETLALPHALQAWQHYRAFDNEAALAAAEAALVLDDENALAYHVRGTISAWVGDFERALADLDRALELEPDYPAALAMKIFVLLESEGIDEARALAEQAMVADPMSPDTLWGQALVAIHENNFELAHPFMSQAIALDDGRPEFYLFRSIAIRQTDQEDEETADVNHALALNPEFGLALAHKAFLEAEQYRFQSLESTGQMLVERWPDWYLGYQMLAIYYNGWLQDREQGLEMVDHAIERVPQKAANYILRGDIYLFQEELELARADYELALTLNGKESGALLGLAALAEEDEDFETAENYHQQIIANLPNSVSMRTEYANLHFRQGDIDRAWELVYEALALDPNYPSALQLRALLFAGRGEYVDALADLSRVIERYPDSGFAHMLRASILLDQGDWDFAAVEARRAEELDPNLPEIHRVLALVAWDNGDLEQAIEQVSLYIEKADFDDPRIHQLLGFLYAESQDPESAIESFTTGLTIEELDELYFNRGLAYFENGDFELGTADMEAVLAQSADLSLIAQAEVNVITGAAGPIAEGDLFVITDEAAGYTVSYPEEWDRDVESDFTLTLFKETPEAFAVVNVIVIDWLPSLTVQDLFDAVEGELNIPGLETISVENVQIGEIDGMVRHYLLSFSDGAVARGRQYYIVSGSKAAVISQESIDEEYEDLSPEFDAIIASFVLLP